MFLRPLTSRLAPAIVGLGLTLVFAAGCPRQIPPPDVQIDASEAQVAKGQYLASTMGCIACHSQRDWSLYGGPFKEGTAFAGGGDVGVEEGMGPKFRMHAQNLTPHHLGDWSDGEIVRATLLGQSKDGSGLFPLMPYFEWRNHVALDDAAAVVAFLRTLNPIARDTPPSKYPMPSFVVNGFPKMVELRKKAPLPTDPDYGEYVTYRSGCMACHTNADKRGRYIGPPFAGGRRFPVPAPGAGYEYAANLTPDPETGIGQWSREAFIARFKNSTLGAARQQPVTPGGFNSVMPWWAYAELSEADLGSMYDFLRTLPPSRNPVRKYVPPQTDGER